MQSAVKTEKVIKLSVVIASLYAPTDLENCLNGVLDGTHEAVEIIVADCCLKEKIAEWKRKFPAVKIVEFPEKTSLEKLLGAGIKRASGEIIAITDSSCVVADDWMRAILRAHAGEKSPVIAGAVEMSESGNFTDWAAYFCDYGEFMLPAPRGVVAVIPGNNLSIKRPVLRRGTEFVEPEFWKTLWCRKLQAEGIELYSEPAIRVQRRKTYKLIPFLVRRFHQGRCFAGMRFAKETFFKRVFYATGSGFLPIVFLFRTVSVILQKKRFLGKFLLSLPIIVLAIIFWSIGETVGFLAGTGTSCERID